MQPNPRQNSGIFPGKETYQDCKILWGANIHFGTLLGLALDLDSTCGQQGKIEGKQASMAPPLRPCAEVAKKKKKPHPATKKKFSFFFTFDSRNRNLYRTLPCGREMKEYKTSLILKL